LNSQHRSQKFYTGMQANLIEFMVFQEDVTKSTV